MDEQKHGSKCGGRGAHIAGRVARGVVIGLAFVLVFSLVVRLLWNWLMPGVFGLGEISYGQSFGMIVLARILFGGRGMHHKPPFAERLHGRHDWSWCKPCSTEDKANSGIENWQHYDAWWEAEGREAFKKYSDSRSK